MSIDILLTRIDAFFYDDLAVEARRERDGFVQAF